MGRAAAFRCSLSGHIELFILTLSLGFKRYWRCDKTCTSVHISALSGTDRDICELTSDIKYLPQLDATILHYPDLFGRAGAVWLSVLFHGVCSVTMFPPFHCKQSEPFFFPCCVSTGSICFSLPTLYAFAPHYSIWISVEIQYFLRSTSNLTKHERSRWAEMSLGNVHLT